METSPRVSPQQFADSMKQEFEEFAKQVMDTVNDAPDGQWIAGSEEQVRNNPVRHGVCKFAEPHIGGIAHF